jgi:hypothetical protein
VVPTNSDSPDALLAIATDLLAQIEAQHRVATRLEDTTRQLGRGGRDRGSIAAPLDVLREQIRSMRELHDSERALLDELEQQIFGAPT